MKLVVGLGNPGPQYKETRHNLGFIVVDEIARRHGEQLKSSRKWRSEIVKCVLDGQETMLVKPQTFMNDSGSAVQQVCAFYQVAPSADLLIVVDDADLPLGRLRLRANGSAGGHNGLKSIIQELGTDAFPRLRIGVGRQGGELKNHVLGRFSADEEAQIDEAVKRAADAAEVFVADGILPAMNRFNAAPAANEP